MKKTILPLMVFFNLEIACSTPTEEGQKATAVESTLAPSSDTPDVSAGASWLVHAIEIYFQSKDVDVLQQMKSITTKEYYDYKLDAMNVDMGTDFSMTEDAFQKKWGSKFDTRMAGIQSGFLIEGQDWEKVSVTKCTQLPTSTIP